MKNQYNLQKELMTVTHFSLDNIDAIFYLGSMFFKDTSGESHDTTAHEHAWYEFHYVESGSMEIKTSDQTFYVKEGDMLFLPPRTYHNTKFTADTRYVSFGFELKPNGKTTTEDLYKTMIGTFAKENSLTMLYNDSVAEVSARLKRYLRGGGRIYDCRVQVMLSTILFSVFDSLADGTSIENGNALQSEKVAEDSRHYLLDLLTSSRIDNLTLDELSQKIYLNKKQINQIVKKRYNMTYKQKQIRFRIENAKKQLSESNVPIDLIAQQVGYTNLTSFYKAFQKIVGMTPAAYRKSKKSI